MPSARARDRQPPQGRTLRVRAAGMATRAERDGQIERRRRILAQVMSAHRATLRRQAFRHRAEESDADDIVQDACAEFLRYYDGPPGEDALRYLMTAVRSCAWAHRSCATRRHAAVAELTTTDAVSAGAGRVAVLCERPGPSESTERRERVQATAHGLDKLKPDQRTALLLLGLGCSYREIATLRGWTHTQVNRSLAEGRAALRRLLAAAEPSR